MPEHSTVPPSRRPARRLTGRGAAIAAATALIAGSAVLAAGGTSASAAGGIGAFAPYVDTSLFPQYDLSAGASTEGTHYFNLAFITDGGSCTPKWGGVTDITDPATASDIAGLRSAGGDVRVSFGGASGTELALGCGSAADLAAAYQKVIDQYSLTSIDFDVEGGAVGDTASIDRRNQAIAILEQSDPSLQVSYTLPVLPSGLTAEGVNVLTSARNNNAAIAAVNVMAMDYGASFPSDMAQDAIDAATSTEGQVKSVWGLSDDQAWSRVAVTPMIGVNDDSAEVFTVADANTLVSFAQSKHLAWLSFWSATRDQPCPGGAQGSASATCSSIDQSAGDFGKAMSAYTG